MKKLKAYFLERFTKEKLSSFSGLILIGLYLAGELTGVQVALVERLIEGFGGVDVPSWVDAITGGLLVATPTSKFKRGKGNGEPER